MKSLEETTHPQVATGTPGNSSWPAPSPTDHRQLGKSQPFSQCWSPAVGTDTSSTSARRTTTHSRPKPSLLYIHEVFMLLKITVRNKTQAITALFSLQTEKKPNQPLCVITASNKLYLRLLTLLTFSKRRSQLQSYSPSTRNYRAPGASRNSILTRFKENLRCQKEGSHYRHTPFPGKKRKLMKATIDKIHNSAFSPFRLFCFLHVSIRKWNV